LSVAFTAPASATAPPSFPSHRAFPVGTQPRGIATGDLNGDGRPDVAVANEGADSVSVLLNTADKTLLRRASLPSTISTSATVLAA
jgi:hypothetical protein